MAKSNLIQYLSSDLENAFRRNMAPGEQIIVSIPGAIGEALIASERRVAVVREVDPTQGVAVYSYLFTDISDVSVEPTPTGGMFVIGTPEPGEEDKHTVYFASYWKPQFEEAAAEIKKLLAAARQADEDDQIEQQPRGTQVSSSKVDNNEYKCSACGAGITADYTFCPACGAQIQDVCSVCSGMLPKGASYCPHCGSETKPATTECSMCGARANSSVMSYCPQCGTSLTSKCASCGGAIVAGWPRCRYCGREIGAEGMIGRNLRMQRQWDAEERTSTGGYARQSSDFEEEVESPAAEHNRKGSELFDEEKFDEAVEEFRRAVALDPTNSSYHCNLAVAYEELNQPEEARREYERTLELDPNDTTALLYLGYLLNESQDPERAAELWRRLTEVAPGSPEAEEAEQNLRAQNNL